MSSSAIFTFSEHFQGWWLHHFLSIVEKKFLISNLNLPWHILRPFPCVLLRWRKWSGLFLWKNISPSDISLRLLHSEVLKALSTSPQTDTRLNLLTSTWSTCSNLWTRPKAKHIQAVTWPSHSFLSKVHSFMLLCWTAEGHLFPQAYFCLTSLLICFLLPQEIGGRCPPGAANPQHHQSIPINFNS